jgi:hypothetical protein
MRMKEIQLPPIAIGTLCVAALSGCTILVPMLPLPPASVSPLSPKQEAGSGAKTDFVSHIKPIFEHRCVRCHSSRSAHAGLNLQDSRTALAAAKFIIPGDARHSRVYLVVTRPRYHAKLMPDDGWSLSKINQRHLRDWINNGAQWPSGKAGQLQDRKF